MKLDSETFIKAIKCSYYLFGYDFMKPYDDDFQWNDFFQFVIFFSLAPMPAIAYENQQEDITIIANKMKKSDLLDTYVISLRNRYLSFNQFFLFFDQTYELWEELFSFRMKMLNIFFPNYSYRKILNRKKNVLFIKQYKIKHNNKFPSSDITCCTKIISFLLNRPNNNRFDYDLQFYPNFSYHDFVRNLIRKYIPNFNNFKIHFKMKYLISSTGNPNVNEIDEMYINFNSYKQKKRNDNNDNNSSLLSRENTSSFSSSKENIEHSSVRSILRNSSNLRYNTSHKRTKLSVQNPTTTTIIPVISESNYFCSNSINKLS